MPQIKFEVNQYSILALAGCLLLLVGCFLPIASSPFLDGNFTFMNTADGGTGDGVIIIGLVVLALPLILTARYKFLIINALLIFAVLLIDFLDINGNDLGIIETEWFGWIVLFVGVILLVASAVTHFMAGRGSTAVQPA
jgi:hypothetical protein